MQDLSDSERKLVLGEVLMDELKAIREGIDRLNSVPAQVQSIDERLEGVENDIKVIKTAGSDQSKQVQKHEAHLKKLRAKTV